jgi:hypothetical protein
MRLGIRRQPYSNYACMSRNTTAPVAYATEASNDATVSKGSPMNQISAMFCLSHKLLTAVSRLSIRFADEPTNPVIFSSTTLSPNQTTQTKEKASLTPYRFCLCSILFSHGPPISISSQDDDISGSQARHPATSHPSLGLFLHPVMVYSTTRTLPSFLY